MKRIIFVLSLMLISFTSFSAETKSSKNDEECRFIASQVGGICENGWIYVTKKDELRGTQDYRALVSDKTHAVFIAYSTDNKKTDIASLNLSNDSFVCNMKENSYCRALMRVNDGDIFAVSYFTLGNDNKIAYFKSPRIASAYKIVIEIPTKENKKRQFVFSSGALKWGT
ncbi:TPA: hypothetical protein N2G38_004484 [Salmonella enterica]|nr:hypothetical protein [Salmonella enterica]